jgi:hypothetical protein
MSPPSSQQNKEKEGEREKEQEGQPPEEKVLAVETARR